MENGLVRVAVDTDGTVRVHDLVHDRIVEDAFYDLDAPIARVCSAEVPIPYAKHLEQAALPQPDKIVAAVVKATGAQLRG